MILTVDVGNTNITLGGFEGENKVFSTRLATDSRRTSDQYAAEIYHIMRMSGCTETDISGCIICSVVPETGSALKTAFLKLTGKEPMMLGPGIKTGINIKIDNPSQLGADLVAGAAGVLGKYPAPCIIIDMGTATTISVMDKEGAFLGGAIAAGLGLTLKALAENTAQLPLVDIKAPERVIGTNTSECMQSGLVFGTAAMIDGLISRMETEIGSPCTVVATGGRAAEIIPHCTKKITLDKDLLLNGLLNIYNKNSEK